jgi:hypothetical protein
MAVVAKRLAVSSMLRKGFSRAIGDDHQRFEYIVDEEAISRTFVSHGGGKDLDDKLLGDMARQCHLSRKQFIAFAKCEMTAEAYRQILIDKGIIPGP